MKKFFTMFCLAMTVFAAFSCQDSLLSSVVKGINAQCPMTSKGYVVNSVEYLDNELVFDCKFEDSFINDQLAKYGLDDQLQSVAGDFLTDFFWEALAKPESTKLLAQAVVEATAKNDPNYTFVDLCISQKVNVKYNVHVGEKMKTLLIPVEELAAARKK